MEQKNDTITIMDWQEYIKHEHTQLLPILTAAGYTLDDDQQHLKGERFLMQAVTTTGGRKLILTGTNGAGERVVIKASSDQGGRDEIEHERTCRQLLNALPFSYGTFIAPKELFYSSDHGFTLSIQSYIKQSSTFLDRPLVEQFDFALHSLQAQERAHAATRKHRQLISHTFGYYTSTDYLWHGDRFVASVAKHPIEDSPTVTHEAYTGLREHAVRIEQYCGFLTHTDFVPHNFRIQGNTLYLLDFSSIRFGNKHEGWARFLNFMTLYNPELEAAFQKYMKDNRSWEERESLHLMRTYRLCEIIAYYTNTLSRCTDNLLQLNTARVQFWTNVLKAHLEHESVDRRIVTTYQIIRDQLRSPDEKERQKGLH